MTAPPAPAIVRLGDGDGERLRRLRLRALADSPAAFGTTLDEAAGWPRPHWEAQLQALATFVAVVDGVDAGLARGERDPGQPWRGWLRSMWVDPALRRHGLGRRLVAAVSDWARDAGCTTLALDVADGNTAAIAFYDALGFAPSGVAAAPPAPRDHLREHQRERRLR